MAIRLSTPLKEEDIEKLNIGDQVLISGRLLTGRDAAHKRLIESIEAGQELPINLIGEIIYYVGPSPAKPGAVIGSAGPTTSGRMDAYTPTLIQKGLKGMIGKGSRNEAVKQAIKNQKAVYFAAIGGAAALAAQKIKHAKVLLYPELGPEAIYEFEVEDFPVTVVNDCQGRDLYIEGTKKYFELLNS